MTIYEIIDLAGHRDVPAWVLKLVKDAVEIEREACAQICERLATWDTALAIVCADAIRARGEE